MRIESHWRVSSFYWIVSLLSVTFPLPLLLLLVVALRDNLWWLSTCMVRMGSVADNMSSTWALCLELLAVSVSLGIDVVPAKIVWGVAVMHSLFWVCKLVLEASLGVILVESLLLLVVKRAVRLLLDDNWVLLVHVLFLHYFSLVKRLLRLLLNREIIFDLIVALLLRGITEYDILLAPEVVLGLVHFALEGLGARGLGQDLWLIEQLLLLLPVLLALRWEQVRFKVLPVG